MLDRRGTFPIDDTAAEAISACVSVALTPPQPLPALIAADEALLPVEMLIAAEKALLPAETLIATEFLKATRPPAGAAAQAGDIAAQ